MKYFISLIVLSLFGCNHTNKINEGINYPFPPPPPSILPSSPPPLFQPSVSDLAEIQINPLPHPFNVNGNIPYAVWVNGKRLNLTSVEIKAVARSLNLEFEQPINTAQIHAGEGWIFPLSLKNE